MTIDRRSMLALTVASTAAIADCVAGDASDGGDAAGDGGNGDGDNDDGENGSEDLWGSPDFPQLDLTTDPAIDEDALADQVRGNVAFSLALLEQLRDEHGDENLFYSPYSVSVALAMTYAGARGETAAEMADALEFALDDEAVHDAFGALEAEFVQRNEDGQEVDDPYDESADEDDGGGDDAGDEEDDDDLAFELNTANALWGQEDLGFEETFLDLLEDAYGAGMREADFMSDPAAAVEAINDWVAGETNERIDELVDEQSVTEMTRLVLTNAVYFAAAWDVEFDPADTEPDTFTNLDGSEAEIDFMHQTFEFPYAEVDGHQLVELPYENGDSSMVVIAPAEGEFEAFEDEFAVDRLATFLEEASVPEVELALPKIGIESSFSLVEAMRSLGMELAFDGGDFSGMTEEANLFVDDILHESFVEVDEEGTEAAAATAVVMDESAPADHVEMTVDRPFLFYVRDRPTETPLFWGRVVDGETLQE